MAIREGAEIASAYVALTVKAPDIYKDINKQLGGASWDKAGSDIGSKLAGGMKKTMKIGAAAAAAVLGTALVKGFGRLKAIETAEAKLKGLGNSAGATSKIMDNALASVKGTAFGMDAAATTAAGAVAAGIKPGKELEGVLKSVANSAAAAGAPMEEMGSIYNKVASIGKAQNDSLQQVADRGIPIYQKLSEQLGVSTEEVFKMASAGKIGFSEFETAMTAASGTVAQEMGNTTSGSFDNMMAALGRLGAKILEDIIPLIGPLFKNVTKWLDEAMVHVEPVVDAFGVGLKNGIEGVKTGWQWMKDNSDWLIPVALGAATAAAAITLWTGAVKTWTTVTKIASGVQAAFNAITKANVIMIVVSAVAALVAGLIYFFTQTETGKKIWADFTKFLGEAWANISQFFIDTWTNVTTFLSEAWENIKGFFSAALQFVVDLFLNWTVYGLIIKHWDSIKLFFVNIWNSITGWIGQKIEEIRLVIAITVAVIKAVWENVWNTIKTVFVNVWNGIKSTLNTMISFIKDKPVKAFEAARDAIGTAWKGIQDLAKKPVKFVIETVINGLIGTINKIPGVNIPKVPLPKGFARGGILPGMSRMSDGDDQLIMARRGEGMMVSEALRTSADRSAFLAANAAGRKGVGFASMLQGLARGGLVNPLPKGSYNVSQPYHGGHNGIDLAAATGTKVYAAADGVVGLAGSVPMGGNEVYIQHANGLGTRYSHLSRFGTRPGTRVKAGNVIGYVGSTGMSTGPHLHYMVHNPGGGAGNYGNHVNPAPYMGISGKDLGEAGGSASILAGLVDWAAGQMKAAFPDGGMFTDVATGLAKSAAEKMAKAFNPFAAADGHTATLYDSGGWLDPGTHLVQNKSGRPEPILTAGQWDALLEGSGNRGDVYVQNPFTGEYLLAEMDHRADNAVDRGIEDAAREQRRYAGI